MNQNVRNPTIPFINIHIRNDCPYYPSSWFSFALSSSSSFEILFNFYWIGDFMWDFLSLKSWLKRSPTSHDHNFIVISSKSEFSRITQTNMTKDNENMMLIIPKRLTISERVSCTRDSWSVYKVTWCYIFLI